MESGPSEAPLQNRKRGDISMNRTTTSGLFFIIILLMAWLAAPVASRAYEVHILCYHHFVEENPEGNSEITLEKFQKHMGYLAANDFAVLSLEDFVRHYQEKSFPDNSVLLTFDDGYLSFFTLAFPVLDKYDFPALIFPIVSHMPGLQRTVQYSEKMSFNNIRQMQNESGLIAVGSHSYDLHYYEDDNSPAIYPRPGETEQEYEGRIHRDLTTSRRLLELQTDQEIIALAWPYGIYTPEARAIAAEAGFKLMFELGNTPFTPADTWFSIPRILADELTLDQFMDLF